MLCSVDNSATKFFNEMKQKDGSSYGAMIQGLVKVGWGLVVMKETWGSSTKILSVILVLVSKVLSFNFGWVSPNVTAINTRGPHFASCVVYKN